MTNTAGIISNTVNYTASSRNQYTVLGSASPLYTSRGELKDDNVLSTYKYDYASRLVRITRGGTNYTFKWDALGRRIAVKFGSETRYTWQGPHVLEEITSSTSPSVNSKWIWGPRDAPLRMDRGGTVSYYHSNQFHSVEKLTSNTGGAVETCEYDAFGRPSLASSPRGNVFFWRAGVYDTTTGLYGSTRTYDPLASLRFTSPLDGSIYTYRRNGPLTPRLPRLPSIPRLRMTGADLLALVVGIPDDGEPSMQDSGMHTMDCSSDQWNLVGAAITITGSTVTGQPWGVAAGVAWLIGSADSMADTCPPYTGPETEAQGDEWWYDQQAGGNSDSGGDSGAGGDDSYNADAESGQTCDGE